MGFKGPTDAVTCDGVPALEAKHYDRTAEHCLESQIALPQAAPFLRSLSKPPRACNLTHLSWWHPRPSLGIPLLSIADLTSWIRPLTSDSHGTAERRRPGVLG
eukprot:6486185-Amphidinium_carterae.1